jgi:DNA-binding transcriptional LysR family regulator
VELRQLEHFVAVAEEASFTRAARRLSYVQSALSVSIQSLERELGVRLFDRTTHRVVLTGAGQALLPAARRTLAGAEETRDLAAAVTGVLRGTLRIGLMQSMMLIDVPALLGRFHREHPNVEIQIRPSTGGSAALVGELVDGSIDIAVVAMTTDLPSVASIELGVEELLLVGRAGLLPGGSRALALSRLTSVTFVDFPIGWGVRAVIDAAFRAAGLSREVTIEVADVATLLQMIRAGLGIALLPASLLPGEDPELSIRRLASPPSWRVVMATPSRRRPSAAAEAFAELVREGRAKP